MNYLFKFLAFLLIYSLLSTFYSCNKDENIQNLNNRIKEINTYKDGVIESNIVIEYSGDKISRITNYKPDSQEINALFEFQYFTDSVICTEYINFNDTLSATFYSSYKFSGDKLLCYNQFGYHNESYSPDFRTTYEYIDNQLVLERIQHFESGFWDLLAGMDYAYENNLLVDCNYYSNEFGWNELLHDEAEYHDDKIIRITRFIDQYVYDSLGQLSIEYEYDGDYLSRLDYFDIKSGDQVGKMEFFYNDHGNLVSMTDDYTRDYVIKEEYYYEEGLGNYEQFILPGGGIASEKNLPHPK